MNNLTSYIGRRANTLLAAGFASASAANLALSLTTDNNFYQIAIAEALAALGFGITSKYQKQRERFYKEAILNKIKELEKDQEDFERKTRESHKRIAA